MLGLCRTCERETNIDGRNLVEREAEHVEKMRAKLAAAGRALIEPPRIYTIIIEGVEYDVINDQLGFGRAVAQPRPDSEP